MVDDGIITQAKYDEIDNAPGSQDWYGYVEEMADEQLKNHPSYLRMENPYIHDWKGGNIDLEKADSMGAFVKSGYDETGEFVEDGYKFQQSDIDENIDEIKDYALDEFGLDDIADLDDWMVDSSATNWLLENGFEPMMYDGIIHKNVIDDISSQSSFLQDQYVVFDPSQIRSTKAKFDPTKWQSSDIMAGGIPLAIGAKNALRNDEDQQYR